MYVCMLARIHVCARVSHHVYNAVPTAARGDCLFEALAANLSGFKDCCSHGHVREKVMARVINKYNNSDSDESFKIVVREAFQSSVREVVHNNSSDVSIIAEQESVEGSSRYTTAFLLCHRERVIEFSLLEWLHSMREPAVEEQEDWRRAMKWGSDIHLTCAAEEFGVQIHVYTLHPSTTKVHYDLRFFPEDQYGNQALPVWCVVHNGINHYEGLTADPCASAGQTLAYNKLDLTTEAVVRRRGR